jgi:ABC-2 type transport system ATP-binding protein
VIEILTGLPSVRDASLFGAGLHIVCSEAAPAMAAIAQTLNDRGIAIQKMELIQPSMEDVFVSLIEGVEAEDESGDEVDS